MTFQGTPYSEMPEESRKQKECPVCHSLFTPHSGSHKYCSETCKGKGKYLNGSVTTAGQYKQISGNWDRYFSRLLQKAFVEDNLLKSF